MNKKFLSAVLFGALMVSSTGTFVSCKDYDDDIDQINKELTDIKSAISELQAKVGAGKFVTNIVKSGDGIQITWNDNSTSTIETIKGANGADGKNGTLVTIVDGYWAFDGVKSEYPAKGDKGETGDKGEDGKDGAAAAAGHDAKISADGYWMVWDATQNSGAGAYVKTEYIAGGATAVAGDHGWTIIVRDKDGKEQSIYIPNSAELLSIEPTDLYDAIESTDFMIYYGILPTAVDWDGHKAVNNKMEAGMYPTLDRDVNLLLNPTAADGTAYSFDFRASDNKELWGLTFGDIKPYEGEKLVKGYGYRAASESGLWTLPRDIKRVELDEYNSKRAQYITQFKKNDSEYYSFAVNASAKTGDASKTIKSQYLYTFAPINLDGVKAEDFGVYSNSLDKRNYTWNVAHKPNFDAWETDGNLILSSVIYDYKLSISKSMTAVDIAKYGLEIVDNGYKFIAKKEAAVDNWITLDVKYILVNGSQASGSFRVKITASDIEIANSNIGSIDAKFNATLLTLTAKDVTTPAALNKHYVYTETLKFDLAEKLGANKDQWIDAMYKNLNMSNNSVRAKILKLGMTLVGGDPINNVAEYNEALLENFIYLDYVDKDGKSCIYGKDLNDADLLAAIESIEGMKVYFIAGTWKAKEDKWIDSPVQGRYYTVGSDWEDGFAIPLNNAFSITVPTMKEEQTVGALDFTFQLTMPDNSPIQRKTVGNQTAKWNTIEDPEDDTKTIELLTTYGEKEGTNVRTDMRDAFTGAFVVTEGVDPVNNTYSYAYGDYNPEANWYNIKMEAQNISGIQIIGSAINSPATKTLKDITNDSHVAQWNTFAPVATVFAMDGNKPAASRPTFRTESVVYDHFGVYPETLDNFIIAFGSKVEDSQKATATKEGTVNTPIEAMATYGTDKSIQNFSFSVTNGTFTMTDAFDNPYALFDADKAPRGSLHTKLIEDRQGIDKTVANPSFYGMNPVVTVDGKTRNDIVVTLTTNKVTIKDEGDVTYYTGMKFVIPASSASDKYGVDKVVKVTYNVKDVFGTVKSFDFYARTVNKAIGNDDKEDEEEK